MKSSITVEDLRALRKEYAKEIMERQVRIEKLDALIATFDDPTPSPNGTALPLVSGTKTAPKLAAFEIVRRNLIGLGDSFGTQEAYSLYCTAGKQGNLGRDLFASIVRKLAHGDTPFLTSSGPGRGKAATYTKTQKFKEWAKALKENNL